jgi:hypothetical protein
MIYRPLAESWAIYENSGEAIGASAVKATTRVKKLESFAAGVGRALRLAAKDARKTARMHGTPIYVWENGKVVAKKP